MRYISIERLMKKESDRLIKVEMELDNKEKELDKKLLSKIKRQNFRYRNKLNKLMNENDNTIC